MYRLLGITHPQIPSLTRKSSLLTQPKQTINPLISNPLVSHKKQDKYSLTHHESLIRKSTLIEEPEVCLFGKDFIWKKDDDLLSDLVNKDILELDSTKRKRKKKMSKHKRRKRRKRDRAKLKRQGKIR
eukprot:TRINITY_DN2010_c0_g1_i1.p1 TRINITY_DN2010_c0_g1~~TRINITY_DN2010_c0_g1_i1.p1  ORF type:complete len:128 (-),score=35.15 TRINITY_DN2010_c0_g1_i1:10-393(-)